MSVCARGFRVLFCCALLQALGQTRDQLEFTIKIRSMFDGFDQSGDGKLSGNELRKALRGLGVFISQREMASLMLRFDQNHDQEIDHAEFEDMVRDLIPPPEFDLGGIFLEQKLEAMFAMMDTSGDGQLDGEELRVGLQKLGLHMHPDHMDRIIKSADKSGDGTVDYVEFAQLYTKYPIHNYTAAELREIAKKWEAPEQVVRDSRPPFNDERCRPGQMVRLRKVCTRAVGYHRMKSVGRLVAPVADRPGMWFVKFKGAGELFLSVGRHNVFELAYMDAAPAAMGSKKNTQIQDLGEPEIVDDDVSEQSVIDFRARLVQARLAAGGYPEPEPGERGT